MAVIAFESGTFRIKQRKEQKIMEVNLLKKKKKIRPSTGTYNTDIPVCMRRIGAVSFMVRSPLSRHPFDKTSSSKSGGEMKICLSYQKSKVSGTVIVLTDLSE
jgi:hypothetical protein